MQLQSKKTSLLLLAITALSLSRLMFVFFNDPEGPNLLVVTVLALMVYLLSLTVYWFKPRITSLKKFWWALLVQVVLVAVLYLVLK